MVEYTNFANHGIIADSNDILVQYTKSEDDHFDHTIKGRISSIPMSYVSWTLLKQILQCQEHRQAREIISIFSKGVRRLKNGYYVLKLKNVQM